ncbi:MAG: penicillin-binding protein 1A [Myxococcota bacterium]
MDNRTGLIVAMAGGVDASLGGFNRATQALRQPGSSFKPYVYAAALMLGMSPYDTVLDAPLSLANPDGSVWQPRNYGLGYAGRMPLWVALARSVNTVSVRVARRVGVNAVISAARRAGVTAPLRGDLSIALGTSEVSVLDQATGYSTFARLGVHIPPGTIARLTDRDGNLLGEAGGMVSVDGIVAGVLPGGAGEQAIPAPVAEELLWMLQRVMSHGTGGRAYYSERARAGKTGTTDDFVDAWFVGMIPDYTVAVWIGAEDRDGLGKGEAGGRAALPAWLAIIEAIERPGAAFPTL